MINTQGGGQPKYLDLIIICFACNKMSHAPHKCVQILMSIKKPTFFSWCWYPLTLLAFLLFTGSYFVIYFPPFSSISLLCSAPDIASVLSSLIPGFSRWGMALSDRSLSAGGACCFWDGYCFSSFYWLEPVT